MNTKEMNDSIYSKSKLLHLVNIWNNDINNEVNDLHLANLIINITIIECYDLQFDLVIQSCNSSKKISNFGRWKFHKILIFYDDGRIWILYFTLKIKRRKYINIW
jgi:hypothetical protein